ncbi:hypothetical protein CDAR_22471 [Caerostris darwini]|uniref:Uncharacterized protein n=1 Tax=Caerostris darwini TaxID=1538125 RepID=A0AAV4UBC6_9ARAC|nr:hypothetical protein CDAR_22471 [Caerostris darwini]
MLKNLTDHVDSLFIIFQLALGGVMLAQCSASEGISVSVLMASISSAAALVLGTCKKKHLSFIPFGISVQRTNSEFDKPVGKILLVFTWRMCESSDVARRSSGYLFW